jgi:hypothetical protein
VIRSSFLFLLCVAATASATTLQPITEDEQIQTAQTIFRGRAEQIDAAREVTSRGNPIVTTVRFVPLAVYKGSAVGSVSLRFLGGKVGDVEMKVDGMPQFRVGGEYILFVSGEGNRACPVVGWSEGSLKVDRQTNAAGEVKASPDVAGTAETGVQPRSRHVLPAGASSSLPDFERKLKARISELGKQP